MRTGVVSPEVAAHLYATIKVADQVSFDDLKPCALSGGHECSYYRRRFLCGVPVEPTAGVEPAAFRLQGGCSGL